MADETEPPNVVSIRAGRGRTPHPPRSAGPNGVPRTNKKGNAMIPKLPDGSREADPQSVLDAIDRGGAVSRRAMACVNMRIAGAPWPEIAAALDYATPALAKTDFITALARTHEPEDWETLRMTAASRAEALFRRSFAMAGADYLVDSETGERIPNPDRLRWHEQAGKDLALHASITGAKAPTKMEISPDEEMFDKLVNRMLTANGYTEVIEAEVLELEEIPDGQP